MMFTPTATSRSFSHGHTVMSYQAFSLLTQRPIRKNMADPRLPPVTYTDTNRAK